MVEDTVKLHPTDNLPKVAIRHNRGDTVDSKDTDSRNKVMARLPLHLLNKDTANRLNSSTEGMDLLHLIKVATASLGIHLSKDTERLLHADISLKLCMRRGTA